MLELMDELSPEQLAELGADLVALKSELEEALAASDESAKPVELDQPIGRLSRMDAIQNQQIAKASRRNHELRLRLVLAAINNLVALLEAGHITRAEFDEMKAGLH